MLNFTIEKPIVNATANAEIFIIPNRACKLSGILDFAKDKFRKLGEDLCTASGTSFDESKDYFVETWITAEEDLGSENLADHGFRVKLSNNQRIHVYSGEIARDIPLSLLKDLKEGGEAVQITFSNLQGRIITGKDYDNAEEVTVNLTLNLTAAQTKYRYRRYGNFEDTLKAVCA